jgi:hypothetical protein
VTLSGEWSYKNTWNLHCNEYVSKLVCDITSALSYLCSRNGGAVLELDAGDFGIKVRAIHNVFSSLQPQ